MGKVGGPLVKVPGAESPRTRSSDVQVQEKTDIPAQEKQESIHPSSMFLYPSGPLWTG